MYVDDSPARTQALPRALTRFGDERIRPIGPVHWAGTETGAEWPGCMEGAIASGERAATEISNLRHST